MSKKILILSASPRKGGNSDTLCDRFMQGATEAGHAVEKIHVADKKINFCIACGHCQTHGGTCVHDDDMAGILQKMIEADVIVMATPVYFFTMNAQLKALIDRTAARYTEIRDKAFYFIATAAVADTGLMERTIESLRGFTDCLEGAVEKGVVYGAGVWKKGEIAGSPSLQQAFDLGKSA